MCAVQWRRASGSASTHCRAALACALSRLVDWLDDVHDVAVGHRHFDVIVVVDVDVVDDVVVGHRDNGGGVRARCTRACGARRTE